MWKLTLPFALLLLVSCKTATKPVVAEPSHVHMQQANTGSEKVQGYDSSLAARLGADDYGMKNYVLCFLKPGKQRLMMVSELEAINTRHLQYMQRLAEEGHLAMMGMFPDGREFYTQLILNTEDMALADSLMRLDPQVKEEIVVPEFHRWYGPAALPELKAIHNRISKVNYEPAPGQ